VWTVDGKERLKLTHDDVLYAAVFSPDERRVATAGAGKDAIVWNAETGRRVVALSHDTAVRAIAYSPDGRHIGTGSSDKTARLWDAASGAQLATWRHEDAVYGVSFSPDSRYLATVSAGSHAVVRVWDVATRAETSGITESFAQYWKDHPPRELLPTTGYLTPDDARYAVAISLDSRQIASASVAPQASVWDTTHTRQVTRFPHDQRVIAVAFSPDGHHIATGSEDNAARVWEITKPRQEIARMTHRGRVDVVAFSNDGQRVASAGSDRFVRIWEASSGRLLTHFEHDGRIVAVSFSADGRYLAIVGGNAIALHSLQPADLIREACARLTSNALTEPEWKPYFNGPDVYQPVCRDSTIVGTASSRK
jgi:WD40 repeat protein